MGGSEEDPHRASQPAAGDPPLRLAEDQFYQALASSHRRRLLYYLLETTESTVDELASVLSGWEVTATGTMHRQADRLKRRIELVHIHLPRLADAGLIQYDPATGSVQLEPLHHRVAAVIRQSVAAENRWTSPNDA